MINFFGGTFTMGNNNPHPLFDDQDPEHLVTIDDFTMGETEVSNAYFVILVSDNKIQTRKVVFAK
jgi:formylglycine-generating enzyme required for sulfatase activity